MPELAGDRLDMKGETKDGQFHSESRSWTLMCQGKKIELPPSHSARLVIFFGSNFSRYALYRGSTVLSAVVDVVTVRELGPMRFKLVDASNSSPTTQGSYLASPLKVEVKTGSCTFDLASGDSMEVDGRRLSVGVCERRTAVTDPHAEPTLCLIRVQSSGQ